MKIYKSPEHAWVWAFGFIYSLLFARGYVSEWVFAAGLSVVFNAYPLSRAVYKVGRLEMNNGLETTEFRASASLFLIGLCGLLAGVISQGPASALMVSATAVYVFTQGYKQKLHADKTIRTQVLLR